jgi:uncharacterized iron-regulated protein
MPAGLGVGLASIGAGGYLFRKPVPNSIRRFEMTPSPLSPAFRRLQALLLVAVGACAPLTAGINTPSSAPDHRLFNVAAGEFVDLPTLADELANVDVLFFGEFHDDRAVHDAQLELLEILADREREVVLGLEMFERDVQPVLDRYLRGESEEDDFLEGSRPWPNYRTDYRPLVEVAREEGWPVIGTNLPQALATAIARGGLAALDTVTPAERSTAAEIIQCPLDDYWTRFLEAITGDGDGTAHAGGVATDPMMQRIFEAQCARDETMAEAIAPSIGSGGLLFHVNGSFHTDHFLGIVPRLRRRIPTADVRVIATVQVPDLLDPDLREHLDRADYLILTLEPSGD